MDREQAIILLLRAWLDKCISAIKCKFEEINDLPKMELYTENTEEVFKWVEDTLKVTVLPKEINCDCGIVSVFDYIDKETMQKKSFNPYEEYSNLCYPKVAPKIQMNWKVDKFKKELEEIYGTKDYTKILGFLKKYFSFIPAIDQENAAYISVYDYVKYLLSLLSIRYSCSNEEIDKDYPLMLVGGDLSGIQSFIYNVSSTGALNLVRGRSFYLDVLCKVVANKIVEKIGLLTENIIYADGGGFCIIGANTVKARNEIKNYMNELNSWLFNNYGTVLYFGWGIVEMKPEDLHSNDNWVWERLSRQLELSKKTKFDYMLEEVFKYESPKKEECYACKKSTDKVYLDTLTEVELCLSCKQLADLGRLLAKADMVVLKEPEKRNGSMQGTVDICVCNMCYIIEKVQKERNEESYDAGTREEIEVPYIWESKDSKGVSTMEEFAKASEGAKKIGVLRMDVDDFGSTISQDSILKKMVLSQRMNKFFKKYINALCKDKNRKVAVVYSGGDDLFIIGSWDDVIELGREIRNEFVKYTGSLTISAGFTIHDYKIPFYKMARQAGEALENSKNYQPNEKNKITAFYDSYLALTRDRYFKDANFEIWWDRERIRSAVSWKEFERLYGFKDTLGKAREYISQKLFFDMWKTVEDYRQYDKFFLPIIEKMIKTANRVDSIEGKEVLTNLAGEFAKAYEKEWIKSIHVPFLWVEYLNRE